MPPIKGRTLEQRSRKSCPTSKPKSSSAPIRSKDLSCCPSAGSSSARLLGSTVVEGLPRIGKTSIARGLHSCASPQSASCSENSAIPPDVLGQTLREASSPDGAQATSGIPLLSVGLAPDFACAQSGLPARLLS